MTMEQVLEDILAVESQGNGPLGFIFLHGGGAGQRDWSEQMRHLGAGFRVVSLDLPGHGGSSTPANASIGYLGAVAVEIKKRFGLARNILVGHSMGCWVALESYRRDPNGIAGIVLIECSRLTRDDAQREALQSRIRSDGGKASLRRSYAHMFLPDTDPRLVAFFLARVEAASDTFIRDIILSTIDWDATHMASTLSSLRVPLLILQSMTANDDLRRHSLSEPEQSPWIAFARAHAPEVDVHIIPHAGHFPHVDQPAAVSAALERFAHQLTRENGGGPEH